MKQTCGFVKQAIEKYRQTLDSQERQTAIHNCLPQVMPQGMSNIDEADKNLEANMEMFEHVGGLSCCVQGGESFVDDGSVIDFIGVYKIINEELNSNRAYVEPQDFTIHKENSFQILPDVRNQDDDLNDLAKPSEQDGWSDE
jgi:hypothetical protein